MKRPLKPIFLALLAVVIAACHEQTSAGGSNSNWLQTCEVSSDCANGLSCWCGLCSSPCGSQACPVGQAPLECASTSTFGGSCASSGGAMCLLSCSEDVDCGAPGRLHCASGSCVTTLATSGKAAGSARDSGLELWDFVGRTADPHLVGGADGGTCRFAHAVCGGLDSYVELDGDGPPMRLAYPSDSGCGVCSAGSCEIWAIDNDTCGPPAGISLSVCAGPAHALPCLDTVSYPPRYTDQSGKTWSSASLTTGVRDAGATSGPILDLDVTLSLSDGSSTLELAGHVRVCGAQAARRGASCR
jgi:hypothetical protein